MVINWLSHYKHAIQCCFWSAGDVNCLVFLLYYRYTPVMSRRLLFADREHSYLTEHRFDESNCSNFLDLDWLSSSGNSCEEETFERWCSSMLLCLLFITASFFLLFFVPHQNEMLFSHYVWKVLLCVRARMLWIILFTGQTAYLGSRWCWSKEKFLVWD